MNEANSALLERIRELKAAHPAWGYRRVWAYLKYRQGLAVNHKRIYRLMGQAQLLVPRQRLLKASRTPTKGKPRTVEPNRYWGIDMSKVMLPSGWAYLHVGLAEELYVEAEVGCFCGMFCKVFGRNPMEGLQRRC